MIPTEDVARQVANYLSGFGYFADETNGNPTIKHADGRELLLRLGTYGAESGRLIISGLYPRDVSGRYVKPHEYVDGTKREFSNSITVSPTKAPDKIAADITRRLLPDYNDAFANVQAQLAERSEAKAGREELAGRLATILRVEPHRGDDEITLYAPSEAPFYQIRISSGDSVRFEHFSCTGDQAEAIIRAGTPTIGA